MYRSASPGTRPPNAVTHFLRRPMAKVIPFVPYLHRIRMPVPKAPSVPATDVREILPPPEPKTPPREKTPSWDDLRKLLRQIFTGTERRVLNQFARCVLCVEDIASYVYRVALQRLRRADRQGVRLMLHHVWRDEATLVRDRMRRFVDDANVTGDCTRRGYVILQSKNQRGRAVFVTRLDSEDRIIGIYSGAKFNRKRANRSHRGESHQQALRFRRQKSSLTPR